MGDRGRVDYYISNDDFVRMGSPRKCYFVRPDDGIPWAWNYAAISTSGNWNLVGNRNGTLENKWLICFMTFANKF